MFQMNEKIGKIAEIVERHDSETFPAMRDTLARMESKQNKDILQFNEAREALHKRIDPIEKDYIERMERKQDTAKELKKIKWSVVGTIILGIAIGAYDHILYLIKQIINYLHNI